MRIIAKKSTAATIGYPERDEQECLAGKLEDRNHPTSTARWRLEVFAASTTWSSHSPAGGCPREAGELAVGGVEHIAQGEEQPAQSRPTGRTRQSMTRSAEEEKVALIVVTAFGVSPAKYAAAASRLPTGDWWVEME